MVMTKAGAGVAMTLLMCLSACGSAERDYEKTAASIESMPGVTDLKTSDAKAYAQLNEGVREASKLPEGERDAAARARLKEVMGRTMADRLTHLDDETAVKVAAYLGDRVIKESEKPGQCDPQGAQAGRDEVLSAQEMVVSLVRMKPVQNPIVMNMESDPSIVLEAFPGMSQASGWSMDQLGYVFQNMGSADGDTKCRVAGAMLVSLSRLPPARSAPFIRGLVAKQVTAAGR